MFAGLAAGTAEPYDHRPRSRGRSLAGGGAGRWMSARRCRDDGAVGVEGTWPATEAELRDRQRELAVLAAEALTQRPWTATQECLVAGCFVAFARGEAGPGRPGDRAWAAAVVWRCPPPDRGTGFGEGDLVARSVVADRVPAAYAPGLLALREGPILAAAVSGLAVRPDVLLVNAPGLDHPRGAGLALHLGALLDVPTVGVTHRPLEASGAPPALRRGKRSPLLLDGTLVGYWVCTRTRARAVAAHAAWRTGPETAAATVLLASDESARTPRPLVEARRAARVRRAEEAGG
jgi:deoxyribonuclease V